MSKKIGLGFEQAVEQEMKKRKVIKLKVSDQDYEVRIKYKLSIDEKTQLIQHLYDLVNEFGEEIPTMVAITIAILQVATDIEFPEDGEGKMKIFKALADGQYTEQIFKAIPDKAMEDVGEFIKTMIDYTPEMIKRLKIEEIQAKESIDE